MNKEIWIESLKNALDSLENSTVGTNMPAEIREEVTEMIATLSAIIENN